MTQASKKTLKQPLGRTAYELICQKIITLAYAPGAVLEEKQLTADLQLGRTPIREALLRLAGEGWLESLPNRGVMVPALTIQGAKAIFAAMKILETGIASLAIAQNFREQLPLLEENAAAVATAAQAANAYALVEANHRFHLSLARCCGNDFLIRASSDVRNQAKRLAYLSYSQDAEVSPSLQRHYSSVVAEHAAIIEHLAARNETALKETVLQHIATFQQRIVAYMQSELE